MVLPFTTETTDHTPRSLSHNTLLLHLLSPFGLSFHNRNNRSYTAVSATQHATPPRPLSTWFFLSQQKQPIIHRGLCHTTRYSSTSSLHLVLPFTTETTDHTPRSLSHNTLLLHVLSPPGSSFHNRNNRSYTAVSVTQHATPPRPLSTWFFLSQQKQPIIHHGLCHTTRYSSTSSLHLVLPFTTETTDHTPCSLSHNTLLLHLLSPPGSSFHNRNNRSYSMVSVTQHATPPRPLSTWFFLSQQKQPIILHGLCHTTRYSSTSSLHLVLPFTTETTDHTPRSLSHNTLLLHVLSPPGSSFHNRNNRSYSTVSVTQHATPPPPLSTWFFLSQQKQPIILHGLCHTTRYSSTSSLHLVLPFTTETTDHTPRSLSHNTLLLHLLSPPGSFFHNRNNRSYSTVSVTQHATPPRPLSAWFFLSQQKQPIIHRGLCHTTRYSSTSSLRLVLPFTTETTDHTPRSLPHNTLLLHVLSKPGSSFHNRNNRSYSTVSVTQHATAPPPLSTWFFLSQQKPASPKISEAMYPLNQVYVTFTQATSFMRATTSNSSNFSILSDRALTFRKPGVLHRELFVSATKLSAFTIGYRFVNIYISS